MGIAWKLVALHADNTLAAAVLPFLTLAKAVQMPFMAYVSPERSLKQLAKARRLAGMPAEQSWNHYLRSLLNTCMMVLPDNGCIWVEAVPEWTPQVTFWLRDHGWTEHQVFPLSRRRRDEKATVLFHAGRTGRAHARACHDQLPELTGWDRDRAVRDAILTCTAKENVVFTPTLGHYPKLASTIIEQGRFCLAIEPDMRRLRAVNRLLLPLIGDSYLHRAGDTEVLSAAAQAAIEQQEG